MKKKFYTPKRFFFEKYKTPLPKEDLGKNKKQPEDNTKKANKTSQTNTRIIRRRLTLPD